jgi:lysophospholipase L1-like esterase
MSRHYINRPGGPFDIMRVLRVSTWCVAVLALTVVAAFAADELALTSRADGLFDLTAPPGTVVRYTLDGSEPTRDSGVWLAPVDVPPGYTLKVRAFLPDGTTAVGRIVESTHPPGGAKPPSTVVPLTQNRDWRTYDWVARHADCVRLMAERQPDIVMLGDSITHFWGGEPSGETVGGRRTGVEVWDHFFAGRRVVNLGFGWDRTENVLWRITHGELEHVTPKVVVLMIGTNNIDFNSADEIASGIKAICDEVHRRSPSTRILLLAIFPRGATPDAAREKVDAVNLRLGHFDGIDNVTFLDIGKVFLEADGSISQDVMYDGLHPTAAGYSRWTAAMKPTLDRLLER